MIKSNVAKMLAGAAAALTIAVSGPALAHGVGGNGSSHMGGNPSSPSSNMGHITNLTRTNKVITESRKVSDFDDHRRFRDRRFNFLRYGYLDIDAAPVCFYKWTHLGRVRICPDLYY